MEKNNPTIRGLTPADVLAVCELHHKAFTQGAWSLESFAEILANPRSFTWGLWDDKSLMGFIMVQILFDEAEILTFAIDPLFQNQGHGRVLLNYCIEKLVPLAVHKIFLEVHEQNASAIHLYERVGFKCVALRPNYYLSTKNLPGNAHLMIKVF